MSSIGKRGAVLLAAAIGAALLTLAYLNIGAAEPAAEPRSASAGEAEELIFGNDLGSKLEVALGDSFAGLWFEPSTAQLHVGVASAASGRQAEGVAARAGLLELVTVTAVDSTWTELLSAQRQLNRDLEGLLTAGKVRTAVSASENRVEVEVASSVSTARQARLQRKPAPAGVDVSISVASAPRLIATPQAGRCAKYEKGNDKSRCDKPIVAGVKIRAKNTTTCTAGPAVITEDLSTGTKATETFILTAGHCIDFAGGPGSEWSAWTKGGTEKLLGKSKEGLFGVKGVQDKIDVGVIQVETNDWIHVGSATPVTPAIAQWAITEEHEPTAVTANGGWPIEGAKVCVSGETSGTHCGVVYKPSVTETFQEEKVVETLVEVTGEPLTETGDSGAPWFLESAPSEAVGVHVGISSVREKTGKQHMLFQTLFAAFENLGTKWQLLTTANEKRKHP